MSAAQLNSRRSSGKPMVLPAPCDPSARGLRIACAAQYMGVSPWFVEEAIRSRKLPARKLGRHYVVYKEDLDAFMDKQKAA